MSLPVRSGNASGSSKRKRKAEKDKFLAGQVGSILKFVKKAPKTAAATHSSSTVDDVEDEEGVQVHIRGCDESESESESPASASADTTTLHEANLGPSERCDSALPIDPTAKYVTYKYTSHLIVRESG